MSSVGSILIGIAAILAALAFAAQAGFMIARALVKSSGEIWTRSNLGGEAQVSEEIIYFLPKTVLNLVVNYTITETRSYRYGLPLPDKPTLKALRIRSVQIEPRLMADERYPLALCGEKANALRDSNQSFVFGEDGTLQGLNVTVTDRTAEVFESIVGAAARVAVLASTRAMNLVAKDEAPPQKPGEMRQALIKTVDLAYERFVTKAQDPQAKLDELFAMKTSIDTMLACLRDFDSNNGERNLDRDLTVEQLLDPGDWAGAPLVIPLRDNATDEEVGSLSCSFAPGQNPSITLPGTNAHPGVLYRAPRSLRIILAFNGNAVFDKMIPFAQFGQIATISAGCGKFESMTTAAKFSAQSGRLKELSRQSTTSVAAAASKIGTAADSVGKSIEEIRKKTGDQAELEQLQLQTKLAIARAKHAKAQNPEEAAKMTVV